MKNSSIENLVAQAFSRANDTLMGDEIGFDRSGEDFLLTAQGKKYRLTIQPVLTLREVLKYLFATNRDKFFNFVVETASGKVFEDSKISYELEYKIDEATYFYVGDYGHILEEEVTEIDENIIYFADDTELHIYERLPIDLSSLSANS